MLRESGDAAPAIAFLAGRPMAGRDVPGNDQNRAPAEVAADPARDLSVYWIMSPQVWDCCVEAE